MECKNSRAYLPDNRYSRDENKSEEIISIHSRRTGGKELLVRGLSMRFSEPTSSVAAVRT